MFETFDTITRRPGVFEVYTAEALWADPYRARQMLAFHLNEAIDVSSRTAGFITTSAAWMVDHFQLGPGKAVCDFGCGPGLYTARLAASGARVVGLDFSENSLAYAREQASRAGQAIDYIHTNYLAFESDERFDLITLIMCDFCALSPAQRQALLSIFHRHLKPGGAVLLDLYAMPAYAAREEASLVEKNHLGHFWYEDDYYAVVNTFKYDAEAVVLDKYSLFPAGGAPETVYNWLQYFSPESLSAELSAAGFEVTETFKDVGGNAFDEAAPEFAVVARPRA